jgi:hypothetical protein
MLFYLLFVYSCKKDEVEHSAPVVVTVGVTDVTDSSAKLGGSITSAGGEEITGTGFCWSSSNNVPTIESDDTSEAFLSSGGFVTELFNLTPSTTYFFRAYAVNSLGVSYGDVNSFTTSNAVPVADSVLITGVAVVDSLLTASYSFHDVENDPDSGTAVQWYVSSDTVAGFESPVSGADSLIYTVSIEDTLKFIRVAVVPASSSGATPGRPVHSAWLGPVPKP